MRNNRISWIMACLFLLASGTYGQGIQILLSDGRVLNSEGELSPSVQVDNALKRVPYGKGSLIIMQNGDIIGHEVEIPFEGEVFPIPIIKDFKLSPDGMGGYLLDEFGGVHPVGNADYFGGQFFGSPFHPLRIARSIELAKDAAGQVIGYYTLNRYGKIFANGSVPVLPNAKTDFAVSLKISPQGTGYAVLTARGEIIVGGQAPVLDQAVMLEPAAEALDFSFTQSGNGYYILDTLGYVHAFGDAQPINLADQVPDQVSVIGLVSDVVSGSVDHLPKDLFSVPTNTPTSEPTLPSTPTQMVEPTPQNTSTPTSTPAIAFTPTPQAPTFTPTAVNTPLPGDPPTATPTSTFTPPPKATSTPTVTPTQTATVAPTATPTPGSDIVPPGVDSRLLGTWNGTAISMSSGQERDIRLNIAVVNNQVVVEDLSSPAFFLTSPLTMNVLNPEALEYTAPPPNLESLALTLLAEGVGITGGYTTASGFPPIPSSWGITIDFNNQ